MWKELFRQLQAALVACLGLTIITGVLYPLVVTGVGQLFFASKANGSLITRDSSVVGSRFIGQSFTDPKYFWGRPSATTPYPYHVLASAGSNLGPTNPALTDLIQSRVVQLQQSHPSSHDRIPIDLVTASGSGLDPHISPRAADYQAYRVAAARGLPIETVDALIIRHTEKRQWQFLGEPRVNVLELNLDLDRLQQGVSP
jgi:K+-transporting ATPase ATPase C chain